MRTTAGARADHSADGCWRTVMAHSSAEKTDSRKRYGTGRGSAGGHGDDDAVWGEAMERVVAASAAEGEERGWEVAEGAGGGLLGVGGAGGVARGSGGRVAEVGRTREASWACVGSDSM